LHRPVELARITGKWHLRTRPVERYTVDCLLQENVMAQISGRKAAKADKK